MAIIFSDCQLQSYLQKNKAQTNIKAPYSIFQELLLDGLSPTETNRNPVDSKYGITHSLEIIDKHIDNCPGFFAPCNDIAKTHVRRTKLARNIDRRKHDTIAPSLRGLGDFIDDRLLHALIQTSIANGLLLFGDSLLHDSARLVDRLLRFGLGGLATHLCLLLFRLFFYMCIIPNSF